MTEIVVSATQFNNENCPFTELFSLLKRYEQSLDGHTTLMYATDELLAMHQHIDNAIVVLLHGIQDVGNLFSMVAPDKAELNDTFDNLGLFISAISNLTEALHSLRIDTDGELRERGVVNY